jgi:hypothetical protein
MVYLVIAGYYVYIETSAPRKLGDKARLIGPSLQMQAGQSKCFSFWYNMLGSNVKALNIYAKHGTSLGSPVWTKAGTQGPNWKLGQVTVTGPGPIQVNFDIYTPAQQSCKGGILESACPAVTTSGRTSDWDRGQSNCKQNKREQEKKRSF